MRETTIELRVCRYAQSLGYYVRKFMSPGHRGVPDRIFIIARLNARGVLYMDFFMIEFKAPGKKASKAQVKEHEKIRAAGVCVYVVDSVEVGIDIINERFVGLPGAPGASDH